MKRRVIFLMTTILYFAIWASSSFAQKGKPILEYGDYSVEEVKAFAHGDSKKSREFRRLLIPLVQKKLNQCGYSFTIKESDIDWIFDQVKEQEVWLESRQFSNSRWIESNQTIEFFISESRYEGNAGVFVYENCSFPLYKVSCANLLDAELNTVPKIDNNILVPEKVQVVQGKTDTVYKEIWVKEPKVYDECVVHVQMDLGYGQYQQPMPIFIPAPVYMPMPSGPAYSSVNIDNSSYYYNNEVTNITNNYPNKPKPKPNPGKPAPAPTHDDEGGPAGAPTHRDDGTNTNNTRGGVRNSTNSSEQVMGNKSSNTRSNTSKTYSQSQSRNTKSTYVNQRGPSQTQRGTNPNTVSRARSSGTPDNYRRTSEHRNSTYQTQRHQPSRGSYAQHTPSRSRSSYSSTPRRSSAPSYQSGGGSRQSTGGHGRSSSSRGGRSFR